MLDIGLRSRFPKWELTVLLFLAPGLCLGSAAVAFKETHLSDVEQRLGMTIFALTIFVIPVFLFSFLFLYVVFWCSSAKIYATPVITRMSIISLIYIIFSSSRTIINHHQLTGTSSARLASRSRTNIASDGKISRDE